MSPQQNNEAAPLTETDAISASPILTEEETAETGILCETPSGRLLVQRRDVASGESLDTDSMIRFVVSPDGILVPDVSHKLPGRGIWLRSERGGLEIALRRNIFSKAAKRQVKADPGLVDQVHGLLRRRCLDLLGLARREGLLISGYEKILGNVKAGAANDTGCELSKNAPCSPVRFAAGVTPSLWYSVTVTVRMVRWAGVRIASAMRGAMLAKQAHPYGCSPSEDSDTCQ